MSAIPLFVVAAAIAVVSVVRRTTPRQAVLRLVAVLAFTAWGVAQLTSGQLSGRLDDAAIVLFVIDSGYGLVTELRTHPAPVGETSRVGCGCGRPCACMTAGRK